MFKRFIGTLYGQVLVFSTLFGVAWSHIGARAKPVVDFLHSFVHGVFSIVGIIMKVARLVAFGAMGAAGTGAITMTREMHSAAHPVSPTRARQLVDVR